MTGDFAQIEREINRAAGKLVSNTTRRIKAKAHQLCPKDTGKTADSIEADEANGEVSTDYYVSYWLEFGTVDMPAKPFMRPAFDEEVHGIVGKLTNAINNVIDGE